MDVSATRQVHSNYPMHALEEAGGWYHLPGRWDLDGTCFIAGVLPTLETGNHDFVIFVLLTGFMLFLVIIGMPNNEMYFHMF